MRKSLKLKEINSRLSKKLKNKKSKISKRKEIINSSSNKRDTNPEHESQERILLIIKKYLTNKDQNKLNEIL